MSGVLGVIPARYASTRFPGKPLAPLGNRTVIEEVWRRASAASKLDRVVVATEDLRIVEACERFGAEVFMTDEAHVSGTDRVAEVVGRLPDTFRIVVNIQGDEPLLTSTSLDLLVSALEGSTAEMATLAEPFEDVADLFNPNAVKLVTTSGGRALYFSRSPIPFHRGSAPRLSLDFRDAVGGHPESLAAYRKHQGLYAYTREGLMALTELEPSPLERLEGLEQLRALEAGFNILVVESDFRSQAVDTPADLERVNRILTEAH